MNTVIGGVPDVWGAQFPPLSFANPKPTLSKHTPVLGIIKSVVSHNRGLKLLEDPIVEGQSRKFRYHNNLVIFINI